MSTRDVRDGMRAIGPNAGHYRRMKLRDGRVVEQPAPARVVEVSAPPPATAPPPPRQQPQQPPQASPPVGARPRIRPFAPTGKPRGAWRAHELVAVVGLGLASLAGLAAAAVAVVRHSTRRGDAPATRTPARRADSVPPK